jgi:hypothetical protein
MTHDELRDHYELYAMGLADEPEKSEIREHLGRGCEVCMTQMKQARTMAAILGGSAPEAAPSPKLRRRILASVGAEEGSFSVLPWLATAAAMLSIVGAVYFAGQEKVALQQAGALRDIIRQRDVELTRLNEAFAILSGPDTTVTSFGAGQQQPPKGKVFANPTQGVMLIASNLPPAPAGKTYEMWIFHKGVPRPARAGEFQSDANGTALHIQRGPFDPGSLAIVAVTLENEGGADQPTSQPLIAATLQ